MGSNGALRLFLCSCLFETLTEVHPASLLLITCFVCSSPPRGECYIINSLPASILQTELLHPKCLFELVSHWYSLTSLGANSCPVCRTGTGESSVRRTTRLRQQDTACHEPQQLPQPPTPLPSQDNLPGAARCPRRAVRPGHFGDARPDFK